jgi:hypothetical protein
MVADGVASKEEDAGGGLGLLTNPKSIYIL